MFQICKFFGWILMLDSDTHWFEIKKSILQVYHMCVFVLLFKSWDGNLVDFLFTDAIMIWCSHASAEHTKCTAYMYI